MYKTELDWVSAYKKLEAESNKRITALEKENAELKADNVEWEKASDKWKSVYVLANNQLTKAKEVIKKFSEFVNNGIEYDPEHPQEHTDLWNKLCEEAEQFLKDCGVEK